MKKTRLLLITIFSILLFPLIVSASSSLTIDDSSYNENTYEFVVSGTSDYPEVIVTLFDGEDQLTMKTVSTVNNSYTTTFNITFEQDKTVTIKVGDTNEQAYDISTLDVKKSVINARNTLTDADGNQLIIKGAFAEFADNHMLITKYFSMDDINAILDSIKGTPDEAEFMEMYNVIIDALGGKEMLQYLEVIVEDDRGHGADFSSHMSGFTYKLKLPKDKYKQLGNFEIAMLGDLTGKLGEPISYSYDEDNEILVLNIDSIGRFLIYKAPVSNAKTPPTGDNIMHNVKMFGISAILLTGLVIYRKKKKAY